MAIGPPPEVYNPTYLSAGGLPLIRKMELGHLDFGKSVLSKYERFEILGVEHVDSPFC